MIQSTSPAAAKSYFDEGFAKGDYYREGQEIAGQWLGRGAQRLSLSGLIERDAFNALCDNRHPLTGNRLTARTDARRTIGYDLNFHCPKSLSAVYELTGDERLMEAFRSAVTDTMTELEADMETRVRKGGVQEENRHTGNLLAGMFVHRTARPSHKTGLPDPHLHAHCFVFNATFDDTEGQWKAGQFRNIKRDAPYYEAAFHARLAKQAARLGYGITRTAKGWDITGVPSSVLDKFSQRTQEIEAEAKARGITDAKAKDALGALTRAAKQKGLGMNELRSEWAARLTSDEWQAVCNACRGHRDGGDDGDMNIRAAANNRAAMDYAVEHLFERESVTGVRQLQATALRYGVGSVTVAGIHAETARPAFIERDFNGRRCVTTEQVLAEEKALLDTVRRGRGKHPPLGKSAFAFGTNTQLNEQQKAAVLHVLTNCDGVLAISGGAGVGKTTLMREAVRGIEEGGQTVFTFAPTADASRGVLRGEGFEQAETVAALLTNPQLQAAIQGQVLWIDEAGLLGAQQMRQLMELAERMRARVILSGDAGQHHAVGRGDVLRLLETHAGLQSARVSEIQRQKGEYKKAVAAFSAGDMATGFARLATLQAVIELPDDAQRYQALAGDYVDAITRGQSVLAVAPTHAEGARVTQAVRTALRAARRLDAHERAFTRLENLQWTQAQRGDAKCYQPGQIVQFTQKASGFARGERVTVSECGDDAIVVRNAHGQARVLPLKQAARFQVYRAEALSFATSDKIRITQNGFTLPDAGAAQGHRLNNGALYEIQSFTPDGDIVLNNGWVLRRDYGHFHYGYCSTSHSSQGKTVDRVLIAQAAASSTAASREQFYVSVSRGRAAVRIYTDDAQALKDAVAGSAARLSATELHAQGQPVTNKATSPRQQRQQRADWLRLLASYARKQSARVSSLRYSASLGVAEQFQSAMFLGL